MLISVATATLFRQPFDQTVEIIAGGGFKNIELDLYWERKEWAMAQHLRDVPVKRAVQMVKGSGLKITSIHDGGGVLENERSTKGFINPALEKYLDEMGYAPECLIFHTPHVEGNPGAGWWEGISEGIVRSLEKYRKACSFVCIENMPFFDGYCVPLTTPEALNAFIEASALSATLDTTHYAQMGTDVVKAAKNLRRNIKTIHLSDFKAGRSHVFIGEGELDLPGFFDAIDRERLNAVTLECSFESLDDTDQGMNFNELVRRLQNARSRLEDYLT